LKQHQIILIQEHWLFEAQINTIGDLNKNINFVGKGVDKYNPVLPKSMPRGYGGVTIIWRENIDHLIKILPDSAERIPCEKINSINDTKFLVASVYLPSKGSHDYVDEFYDCIDQLYEIYQRYQGTHTIIIGGDLNEDLNNEKTNKMNKYLWHFIKECGLSYDNSANTFIKPNGEECSELDYFLHTINYKFCTKKEVLNNTITNGSVALVRRSISPKVR
jgi:exonuclease III